MQLFLYSFLVVLDWLVLGKFGSQAPWGPGQLETLDVSIRTRNVLVLDREMQPVAEGCCTGVVRNSLSWIASPLRKKSLSLS